MTPSRAMTDSCYILLVEVVVQLYGTLSTGSATHIGSASLLVITDTIAHHLTRIDVINHIKAYFEALSPVNLS
jgi:hypothetical protein